MNTDAGYITLNVRAHIMPYMSILALLFFFWGRNIRGLQRFNIEIVEKTWARKDKLTVFYCWYKIREAKSL